VYNNSIPSSHIKGKQAERRAALYLAAQGYTLLAYNYHTRRGEIDLIARDGDCLVFVEVKSRSSDRFGTPEEAITSKKRQRLSWAARHYLMCHPWALDVRFDVVTLFRGQITLYQNALEV